MPNFERQTDMNLNELVEMINGPMAIPCGGGCVRSCAPGGFPAGGLAHEIGVIFVTKDPIEEAERAMWELVNLLDHEFEAPRFVAYCFLKQHGKDLELINNRIRLFEKNPQNKSLVFEAMERLFFLG